MNAPGQREPASYSAQELADSRIDPTTLRHIAAVRQDLWPLIHDHPNCDQGLAEYIRQNKPPGAPPPPPPPGAQPRAEGQPPGPQPPTGAPPAGSPPPGGQPQPGAQQMASGARQLADGAKSYFTDTVVPAATSAAQTVSQRSGQTSASVHWTIWFRFALPVLALLGIISLFMPIASASYRGTSMSINYFSEEAPSGEGAIILIAFVLVIGFAVVSLLTGKNGPSLPRASSPLSSASWL